MSGIRSKVTFKNFGYSRWIQLKLRCPIDKVVDLKLAKTTDEESARSLRSHYNINSKCMLIGCRNGRLDSKGG